MNEIGKDGAAAAGKAGYVCSVALSL